MHPNFESCVFKIMTAGGSGSGFYLSDKRIFVTNYHVVGRFKRVSVQDSVGNRHLAEVVLVNPFEDIAFLKAKSDFNVPEMKLHMNSASRGEKVFVAGYPYGMPFTVTEGIVSAPNQVMQGKSYIQTDAAINPGNSGGPVFNVKGEVIGITTSKFKEAENMGFAVPVSTLVEEFETLSVIAENTFNLVCDSCSALIAQRVHYCQSCGQHIDEKHFDEPVLSALSVFCEQALSDLGIEPVIARQGPEFWEFHFGSARARIFVYQNDYLYATSPLNQLPTKNMQAFLEEITSRDLFPFRLGLWDKELHLAYRVHISDVIGPRANEVKKNIGELFRKANELDDYFADKYGCKFSVTALIK